MRQDSDSQRRFLLALTLSIGALMVFQYLFVPPADRNKQKKEGKQQETTKTARKSQTSSKNTDAPRADETTERKEHASDAEEAGTVNSEPSRPEEPSSPDTTNLNGTPESPEPSKDEEEEETNAEKSYEPASTPETDTVRLENDQMKATFSVQGAALSKLILKEYYRTAEKKEKVQLFDNRFKNDTPSFAIRKTDEEKAPLNLNDTPWKIESRPTEARQEVVFSRETPKGYTIRKTFSLPEDRPYMIDYEISFHADESLKTDQLKLYSPGGIVLQSKQDQDYHLGIYGYKTEGEWAFENEHTPSSLSESNSEEQDVNGPTWTGVANKYFASAFIPRTNRKKLPGFRFQQLKMPGADDGNENAVKSKQEILHPPTSVISYFITDKLSLTEGDSTSFQFNVYAGPKKESVLETYENFGLPLLINYGMFGFFSGIFMDILSFLYGFIGNYGVAILVLTLVVKLLLHPITKKAQVSMHKMKELQPKIEELQEKYEDDRQKLGEEQMKLFKEHGVNPLGGCLPMLFQLPILIGLYYGIRVSFQVRQKPFMLWVNDLSQPDHFMEIGLGNVFGFLDLQYLNLLIIFMMITWGVQSFTQPTPQGGDGQAAMQQKMFKFMPMIFGVICYNFPSGLVLYWMTSTLFSALEQLYIRKIVLSSS